ncbi:MAG: DUF4263 domain-containing protein, partial [bacterium]|nr:DUF4263 domain-containing protein [bacterium]
SEGQYKNAHSHIALTKEEGESLIPDFVLEPIDSRRLCDLLELKLPTAPIYVKKKNRSRYSARVFEACAQLKKYKLFFDEEKNRNKIQENYGLLSYKPMMLVIIGRKGNVDPIDLKIMDSDIPPNVRVLTYDDVVDRAKRRVDFMKKGKI